MSLRIFIGYDKNETVAYHVLAHRFLSEVRSPSQSPTEPRQHARFLS